MEFETRVAGIPCLVEITDFYAGSAPITSGPPELCDPGDSSEVQWRLLDRRGYPAAWLERKLSEDDRTRIDNEALSHAVSD